MCNELQWNTEKVLSKYALKLLKKFPVVIPQKIDTNWMRPFAWGPRPRANEDDVGGGVVPKVFWIVGKV